jgi:predicted PurR-regulated permease PerM
VHTNPGVSQNRRNHAATSTASPNLTPHREAEPAKPPTPSQMSAPTEAADTDTPPETEQLVSATAVRSVALTVIAVIGSVLVLQYARPVLIPIVIGVLISYVLGPAVDSLARHGLPRWAGAVFVIVLLCGTLGYSGYKLAPQILSIVDDMPRAARRLLDRTKISKSRQDDSAFDKMQRAATEIDKAAALAAEPTPTQDGVQRVQIIEPAFRATDYLWAGGRNVVAFTSQFAMVMFLVFFLLLSGDLFKRKLVKIAGPTLAKKKVTIQILDDINQQISGFLRVQVLTSALVGVLTSIALWYFGVRQYIIWGILAGVFNSIPYLGPLIVTGGLGVVVLIQFDDLLKTSYVCGITLAITSLEGWLLNPALMSRAAQMNPVAIFVGLLFWSWVWGVWGTILAVPMMMTAKAICDRIEDLQPVGELLGE